MNLETADKLTADILAWLTPYCERVEVAGSIRRRRPNPADIDLVVEPTISAELDLLGGVIGMRNLTHEAVCRHVNGAGGKWLAGKEESRHNLSVELPECQLDIFFATPETWGTVLLCRTGSKEHNIWLAQRATAMGLHWAVTKGVVRGHVVLASQTEHEIFRALALQFIEPENRERT